MLSDGLATEMPRLRKVLFERALGLLDLGQARVPKRLAAVVDDILSGNCADYVRQKLKVFDTRPNRNHMAVSAMSRGSQSEMGERTNTELWPADPAQGILIVNFVDDDFPSSSSIFALIQKSVLDSGIGRLSSH